VAVVAGREHSSLDEQIDQLVELVGEGIELGNGFALGPPGLAFGFALGASGGVDLGDGLGDAPTAVVLADDAAEDAARARVIAAAVRAGFPGHEWGPKWRKRGGVTQQAGEGDGRLVRGPGGRRARCPKILSATPAKKQTDLAVTPRNLANAA
jgi:hypothetical protein